MSVVGEKRRRLRRGTPNDGVITWNNGRHYFSCLVRNQTPDGAKVSVPNRVIPSEVHLINIRGQYAHRAQLAWMKNTEAGLVFLEFIDLTQGTTTDLRHLVKLMVAHTRTL